MQNILIVRIKNSFEKQQYTLWNYYIKNVSN